MHLIKNQINKMQVLLKVIYVKIYEQRDPQSMLVVLLHRLRAGSFVKEFDISSIKDVKIYSKTDCKFCTYSKEYLKSYNIEYKEEELAVTKVKRDAFFAKLNMNLKMMMMNL